MHRNFVFAAIALAATVYPAAAATIQYSESLTTDGVLGGTSFTGKLVTLTFTADPAAVTFFQGSNFTTYTNVPSVSMVTVAGVGTATFSDPISLAISAFPTFGELTVTDTATSTDILDTFANASGFAGYNFATAFGPVSGGAAYTVGATFATSAGTFDFTKSGGGVSTFVAGVPEPSTFGLGFALVIPLVWRRRTQDAALFSDYTRGGSGIRRS